MFSHPPEARSSLAFTLVLVCSVSDVIYRLCINASGKVIANWQYVRFLNTSAHWKRNIGVIFMGVSVGRSLKWWRTMNSALSEICWIFSITAEKHVLRIKLSDAILKEVIQRVITDMLKLPVMFGSGIARKRKTSPVTVTAINTSMFSVFLHCLIIFLGNVRWVAESTHST